ncbi:PHP domain-containing protein, partial [Bordetella avium]
MSALLPGYAELDCQSNFSFLTGASHPEELVERAAKLGYAALAITDECSLAGVVRAHVEAGKHPGLKLLIGSRLRLDNGTHTPIELVLLACDKEGYGNLAELITLGRTRAVKGQYLLRPADLTAQGPEGGVPGCLAILTPAYGQAPAEMAAQAQWLARH